MAEVPGPPVFGGRRRRGYLDWLRGVAVLIMIEGHLLDSWTRSPDRDTPPFGWAMILGGIGGPVFLFLAGVAVPMSAGSKFRRNRNVGAASFAVIKRGLEVFGLAFLFRIQAWVLGWSSPRALLKVDILNIMGPSIMAAGALWAAARTTRGRCVVFAAATIGVAMLTPVLRNLPVIVALPDPLEAYVRPVAGLSNFVFLPWAGFAFGGALIGVLIDSIQTEEEERRLNHMIGIGGFALASSSLALSHLPNPFMNSYFWTTSPAFFFMRLGIMIALVAVAYAWESRPGGSTKWSPLKQLGRTSLFIYWIHVEMVYGLISVPLHKSLTLGQASLAFALFTLFMLVCSILKDRVVARFKVRRPGAV